MDAMAEKHGVAASEPGRPDTPDWTIAQRWDEYTAAEHAVWKDAVRAPDRAAARPRL